MTMTHSLEAWIDGIGLLGPGLENWTAAQSILAGKTAYVAQPLVVPPPMALPPAERRRVGLSVKVALAVAQEAVNAAQADAKQLAAVFTSSGADGDNCDAICQVLASDDRHISPTRFHNSVHNAPAGYWGIASGAMKPANVVCAYDASFGAGLLDAMTQVGGDTAGVLLVAYEAPYPEPLHAKRPHPSAFGLALALMPQRGPQSLARIRIDLVEGVADTLSNAELEALRRQIPCARGLPLAQLLASSGGSARVLLEYLAPLVLAVEIEKCIEACN
jgi:hypothetical protein